MEVTLYYAVCRSVQSRSGIDSQRKIAAELQQRMAKK